MRTFLKKLYIVGAVLVFREGYLIKYCLNDLLKYCNTVLVLLDNYDEKTERIVLAYQKKYKDRFIVAYSNLEGTTRKEEKHVHASMKRRLNNRQPEIRGRVLEEVKKLHKKKKIDLLIFPDADECFTDYFPFILKRFWYAKDKKVLFIKPITVIDGFDAFKGRTLAPHTKAFKYRPDMSTNPYRFRGFHQPFKYEEAMTIKNGYVHLAFLNKKITLFRKQYSGRVMRPDDEVWILDKDVRRFSPAELTKIRRQKPTMLLKDYLKDRYGKFYFE